jgi:hypothetical protein
VNERTVIGSDENETHKNAWPESSREELKFYKNTKLSLRDERGRASTRISDMWMEWTVISLDEAEGEVLAFGETATTRASGCRSPERETTVDLWK